MIPSTLFALSLVVAYGPGVPRMGHATTIDPAIDRADGAFLDGDYQRALEGYLHLYSRTQEPNYLHNIASCYQKLGSFEQAIEYFTRYLEVGKDVDAVARGEVRRTIEQLRAALRQRRVEGAAATPAPAPVSPAPLLPPPALPPPAFAPPVAPLSPSPPPSPPPVLAEWPSPSPAPAPTLATPTPPGLGAGPVGPPALAAVPPPLAGVTVAGAAQPAARDGRSVESLLRGAAIVEAGLGVAALGMGVYFGARASSLERQVAEGKVFDAYADRDGQRASAYQYGMFTAGGALLVGSAAFFYCSYLAGQAPARIAVLPAVGTNGAGGALTARF